MVRESRVVLFDRRRRTLAHRRLLDLLLFAFCSSYKCLRQWRRVCFVPLLVLSQLMTMVMMRWWWWTQGQEDNVRKSSHEWTRQACEKEGKRRTAGGSRVRRTGEDALSDEEYATARSILQQMQGKHFSDVICRLDCLINVVVGLFILEFLSFNLVLCLFFVCCYFSLHLVSWSNLMSRSWIFTRRWRKMSFPSWLPLSSLLTNCDEDQHLHHSLYEALAHTESLPSSFLSLPPQGLKCLLDILEVF